MPDPGTLAAFAVMVAVFAAVPGPSNLFVVARGLSSGRGAALAAAVGCALGASVYVVATVAGIAALIASSTTALSVLHLLGGLYLLVLGVRALRASGAGVEAAPAGQSGRASSLWQGFLAELGNPKVALFFLAFFPQFVRADRGPAWSQVLVLGVVFCLVGLASDSLYAVGSGALQGSVLRRSGWLRRTRRASGVVYLGLGAWAIASGARSNAR